MKPSLHLMELAPSLLFLWAIDKKTEKSVDMGIDRGTW